MKTQLIITAALLLFASCSKNIVKNISVNASTQDKTYDDGAKTPVSILEKDARVHEGDKVNITVTNYNPLAQTISIDPVQTVLFYQSANTLITTLFPLTPSAAGVAPPVPTPPVPTPPVPQNDRVAAKKKTPPPVCNDTDPLYKAVNDYETFKKELKDNYATFTCYYSDLTNFNSQYNEYKLYKVLTQQCVCDYLSAFDVQAATHITITTKMPVPNCPPVASTCPAVYPGCTGGTYTTHLLNANTMFKLYFSNAADSLVRLQARIASILKDKKYTDYTTYYTNNFAPCKNGITGELLDKKFSDDITADISVYQNFNKTYAATYDSFINSAITEYTNLSHLTFEYVKKSVPVENTDEFKTNVVIVNSVKPETLTIPIDLDVTKTIKIDFSAGAFYAPLSNESYTIKQKVGTVDSFAVHKYNTNNFKIGPMGYINFHTQLSGDVNYGLFLGTGLGFNQSTDLVLAGGANILFGKYQRLLLHFGAAFSQVNRIASKYDDATNFADASYVPATIQKWDGKFMVGLSWNLSRTQ